MSTLQHWSSATDNEKYHFEARETNKRGQKVSVIHDMVPEDMKTQARKALKTIYPRMPRLNYLEDTVVCDQKNCR